MVVVVVVVVVSEPEVIITQENHQGKHFSRPRTSMTHPHSQFMSGHFIILCEFLEKAGVVEIPLLHQHLLGDQLHSIMPPLPLQLKPAVASQQ